MPIGTITTLFGSVRLPRAMGERTWSKVAVATALKEIEFVVRPNVEPTFTVIPGRLPSALALSVLGHCAASAPC
ncbi:hypothetical protein GCM10025876_12230 [Demequina litorisediminis]|uniref:Uncharacterized protein n=1 Tax=Demequina litorisediminis TaxID=1849022 RepID=A0ABQ6IB41_9MICO|nr:hypothetical protein GCM10025876_12230 [Demequina litorisediminis]